MDQDYATTMKQKTSQIRNLCRPNPAGQRAGHRPPPPPPQWARFGREISRPRETSRRNLQRLNTNEFRSRETFTRSGVAGKMRQQLTTATIHHNHFVCARSSLERISLRVAKLEPTRFCVAPVCGFAGELIRPLTSPNIRRLRSCPARTRTICIRRACE